MGHNVKNCSTSLVTATFNDKQYHIQPGAVLEGLPDTVTFGDYEAMLFTNRTLVLFADLVVPGSDIVTPDPADKEEGTLAMKDLVPAKPKPRKPKTDAKSGGE